VITKREKVPAQVSVERIVKCGCGACGSCDLGGYRVCKDGPVFGAEALKMTEFGKWKREKSGKRIAITPQSTNVLSIPPSPFTPEYEPLLKTDVCGIGFPNPIANAAGFGVSGRLLYRYAVAGAGAVVTKSIGLDEQEGYPNPTFFELSPHSRSYVNAMGLPNPGIKNYGMEIEDAKYADVPLILSIFGKNVDECRQVAEIAVEYPIDMLEFNASCPHSDFVAVENNPKLLRQIIKVLRDIAHPKGISVAVKISPNVGDPAGFAVRLEQAGADAITAINTVISRPVDPTLDIPLLGNPTGYGGKSGRDLTAGGKKTVFDLYKELKIPIIAVGGIFSGKDVIEYAKNGASLFQVGSALVSEGFEIYSTIKKELKEYLVAKGHKNIGEIVGEAHRR
jgi:dihydroorotate dehydrogenase (NAD+) catalytic subunit